VTIWFTDVRKIAFITFVTSLLGLLIPGWNSTQEMIGLESTHPQSKLWMTPMLVLGYLVTATMPMFYFALFRNEGTLHLPRRFRPLALVGILGLGLYMAVGLSEVIKILRPLWTETKLFEGRSGATSGAGAVFAELSNLAAILLLIAFFRQAIDRPHAEIPVSRLLSIATKAAVIAFGLWSAFNVVRLVLSPLVYSQLRNYALQVGREPPQFGSILAEVIPAVLASTGLFIAPYIVYKSQARGGGKPG